MMVPTRSLSPAPSVLFVSHTGRIGGAEMCLMNIVSGSAGEVLLFEDGPLRERLVAQGTRVTTAPKPVDLRAIRRDRGMLGVLPVLSGVARLIWHIAGASARHDVIYCNSQKSFVLGAFASCINRQALLWHLHDILDRSHFARAQIRLVIALANLRASRVVAPSRAVADAFVIAGGRASLITVVANGVAVAQPTDSAADRAALRERLGLPSGFLFGVFSRLAPWKGQNVALDALARLPGASCIIAGDALFGEEAYARALHRQAETLGVSERVRFLGQRDDVPLLMQAVDVVVHPSVSPEPFGLTLVEAMLAGVPVVASDTGAAGEILAHGRAGALVAPADSAALAEAIERCRVPDEALAAQVGAAHRRATLHYGVERLRREIWNVAAETAAGRKRQASGARSPCRGLEQDGIGQGGISQGGTQSIDANQVPPAAEARTGRAVASFSQEMTPPRSREAELRELFLDHAGHVGGAEIGLTNVAEAVGGTVMLFQDVPLHARRLAQGEEAMPLCRRRNLRTIRRDRGLLELRRINRVAGDQQAVACDTQKSFMVRGIASFFNRAPLVWRHHHVLKVNHFRRLQISLVVAIANRRASRVVVVSRAAADAFVAAGGRADLVTVVLDGARLPPHGA